MTDEYTTDGRRLADLNRAERRAWLRSAERKRLAQGIAAKRKAQK